MSSRTKDLFLLLLVAVIVAVIMFWFPGPIVGR